jgi:hypothetical protein
MPEADFVAQYHLLYFCSSSRRIVNLSLPDHFKPLFILQQELELLAGQDIASEYFVKFITHKSVVFLCVCGVVFSVLEITNED